MSVELNHTIVHARDLETAARFMSEVFDLPEPETFGPFLVIRTANGVSLDYIASSDPVIPRHFAFLVSEAEFDEIFGRVRARGLDHWADPAAAASTSATPPGTSWRSSPAPTAAAPPLPQVKPRGERAG
jgi:hypothetical protein